MIAGETSRSPADRAAVGPHQRGPARTGRKWTCAPARTCAAPGPALDRDRSRAGSTMPSRTGGDHRTVDAAAPCSTSIRPGLMREPRSEFPPRPPNNAKSFISGNFSAPFDLTPGAGRL